MSELCQACGLCCQGILFDYGHVFTHEIEQNTEHWQRAGVDWYEVDGEFRFRLPCLAHDRDGRCSCYAVRPQVCAGFHCRLLMRHQSGELPATEALRIIDRMARLCAGLRQQLQTQSCVAANAPFHEQLRQFREWYAAADSAQRAPVSHCMAQQRALILLFEAYFYVEK